MNNCDYLTVDFNSSEDIFGIKCWASEKKRRHSQYFENKIREMKVLGEKTCSTIYWDKAAIFRKFYSSIFEKNLVWNIAVNLCLKLNTNFRVFSCNENKIFFCDLFNVLHVSFWTLILSTKYKCRTFLYN